MENILYEVPTINLEDIHRVFEAQQLNARSVALTTHRERIVKLKSLQAWLEKNQERVKIAIYKDFKKPATSVLMTELLPLFTELKHTISNLREWMKPTKVAATLPL